MDVSTWNVGTWIVAAIDGGMLGFILYAWLRGVWDDPAPYIHAFKRNDTQPGDMP